MYLICCHGHCSQSTTHLEQSSEEDIFFSGFAVWNWTVMGQLRLHVPRWNIWKHLFMIPHGHLILMKIFTTRLASFSHSNALFPLVERLTMVFAAAVPGRHPNTFCRNNSKIKKNSPIFLQFSLVSRPTAAVTPRVPNNLGTPWGY